MFYSYFDRLQATINWLTKSYKITGEKGFSIGFDLRKGWLTSYSETTGYIIPTLYRYATIYKKSRTGEIATAAAQWLISIQNEDGSINDFVGHYRKPNNRPPVVFNTGQDLFGLLAAYRFTNDDMFLESAKKAADWIICKQDESGLWNDTTSFGSTNIAAYYSHVTWPLFLVGKELSDDKIKERAEIGLERILDQVNTNYSVKSWGFSDSFPAFTHTIAYTIEGMLMQGFIANGDETNAFTKAKDIAYTTLDLIEKNGKIAGSYDENWNGDYSYICMPGNCQFAIIFLYLYEILGDNQFLNAADKVLLPVLKRQLLSSMLPSAIRGTIPASWPPVLGKYMRWLYPNWGAKYLADAIMFRMLIENDNSDLTSNISFDLLQKYPG